MKIAPTLQILLMDEGRWDPNQQRIKVKPLAGKKRGKFTTKQHSSRWRQRSLRGVYLSLRTTNCCFNKTLRLCGGWTRISTTLRGNNGLRDGSPTFLPPFTPTFLPAPKTEGGIKKSNFK